MDKNFSVKYVINKSHTTMKGKLLQEKKYEITHSSTKTKTKRVGHKIRNGMLLFDGKI